VFGDWLQAQLDRRDMTQSQLSRATGRSTAAVNRWVKNLDIPGLDNVQAIARALAMDVYEVAKEAGIDLPGDAPPRRSPDDILAELEANQPVAIPIIKDLVAHMGAGGGFVDDYVYLSPSFRRRSRRNIRAFRAIGDCMLPQIADGDVVIFDMDLEWKPKDVVVARTDGQAIVRRLVEIGGRMVLRSDADGDTHALTEDDHIYGKVIAIQRSLGAA
jgi:SOS-response transcriptional repressor LexA